MTILGGGYLGIPHTSPRPRLAARVLDFLLSPTVQEQLAQDLGWFPVRNSTWDVFEAPSPGLEAFLQMRGEVAARPAIADYDRLSALWQEAFSRILFEREEPGQVAAALAKQISKLEDRSP